MRSGLPLGVQLLEGRNTLLMPEDVPPCVPRGTTISVQVNFYTSILHRGHPRVTGPGILCLCLPGDRSGTDVLGACLGCTHTSGSMWDVPMWWGSPTWSSCRACVYTPCPGRGPMHRAIPKEMISLHLGPQSHSSSWAFLPVPSTIAFQPSRWPFLIWREGRCSSSCRQDSLQESVDLSPLRMSRDLDSHHGPRAPANSPWQRGSPSFFFRSCLGRGAGSFLYRNAQLERAGAREDFRLWEWISQKKPTSRRQTNLEMCSCL